MDLTYSMEELLPVWESLTRKYCGYESSSITYEKAQQLMEAVIYCVREWEQSSLSTATSPDLSQSSNCLLQKTEPIPAKDAYKRGLQLVKEKTLRMKALYHALLPRFDSYGVRCLEDVIYCGIPEFFRWYDPQFDPQNTILTLDYPVLTDLSGLSGIDAVYEYVLSICREQAFLRQFESSHIRAELSRYSRNYQELIENICQLLFPGLSF